MQQSYKKVSEYIWNKIYSGELKVGDKIATERELGTILEISRNSVREGLKILINMGIISSIHGSGNYICNNFEERVGEIMSFMYLLNNKNDKSLSDFRHGIEWQAVRLICGKITKRTKDRFLHCLHELENASDEKIATIYDKEIHDLIILSTDNEYMICNYYALTKIMSLSIPTLRGKIIMGRKGRKDLLFSHRQLVEGLIEDNVAKALAGLELHFKYIDIYGESL